MRCLVLVISCFLFAQLSYAQNAVLKRQLDSIMQLDQLYRSMSVADMDAATIDSLAKANNTTPAQLNSLFWLRQSNIDKQNLVFVESIIKQYGYPGKTLVGTPTNEAAWYVIQHSDKIATYFPLIKAAGLKGELPMSSVAMMEDRLLMQENKPQLYGTQGIGIRIYDKVKDTILSKTYIWPIKDAATVDKRRKQVGFDYGLEGVIQSLKATYDSKLTVDDVQRMRSTPAKSVDSNTEPKNELEYILERQHVKFDISGLLQGNAFSEELKQRIVKSIADNCPVKDVFMIHRAPKHIKSEKLDDSLFDVVMQLVQATQGKCDALEVRRNQPGYFEYRFVPSDDGTTILTLYIVK